MDLPQARLQIRQAPCPDTVLSLLQQARAHSLKMQRDLENKNKARRIVQGNSTPVPNTALEEDEQPEAAAAVDLVPGGGTLKASATELLAPAPEDSGDAASAASGGQAGCGQVPPLPDARDAP